MSKFPDEGAVRWMHAYARRNHWRVAAWMDYDDLIQEGYYAWFYVCRLYPNIESKSHLMSMFKLAFSDTITDLSRKKTKQQDDARSDIVEVYESPMMVMPDPLTFQQLVIKAPKIVKDTIALLMDDKKKDELNKPFQKYDNGRRETLNDRLCAILGLDSNSTDCVKAVRLHFQSA